MYVSWKSIYPTNLPLIQRLTSHLQSSYSAWDVVNCDTVRATVTVLSLALPHHPVRSPRD